jgi:4-hydroxy-tetrahydrodipicolinate synthase
MHDLCAAGRDGRHGESAALNERLMPLHKAMFLESNPIPVKWAVHRLGLIGQGIRLPLTPLSPPLHGIVEAAMRASGLQLP